MPPIEITEEKIVKEPIKGKVSIASINIGRDRTGLELTIKSQILEEFIKSAYGGATEPVSNEWGTGEKFYKLQSGMSHPTLTATRHTIEMGEMSNNWLVRNDDTLNMAFLRVAGIKDGKSFKFRGLYRESDIATIAQSINEGLKNLFKEYSTPTCYEIEILSEK